MEFITKLSYTSNIVIMREECNKIINEIGFNTDGQISLKSKDGSSNPWYSGTGSLYDYDKKIFIDKEENYTIWNLPQENYIRKQIENLEKVLDISIGRVRIMRLKPKHGLSVHRDLEVRLHFVLDTNSDSYFALNNYKIRNEIKPIGEFYHIPSDSNWYMVDTTKTHWVYNGGKTDRLHVVACASKVNQSIN